MPPPPTIAFLPDYKVANAYTVRMQEILSSFGRLEKLGTKARVLRLLRGSLQRVDLVVVNWEENALVSQKTRGVSPAGTIKLLLKVIAMKLFARRMVFVRHNHYPHATRPKSTSNARWLVDRYESAFDFVFVHSGAELQTHNGTTRRHYLPHPLYRTVSDTSREAPPMELPERYFVAFGRIVPYKKTDSLMMAFPASENLVVCGEVGNRDYAAALGRINRKNVIYRPGYVSEEAAQALVTGAQAVVIAHDSASTIVSGTFFYALSLERHVFAVRTPFLDWIAPRLGPDILTLADDIEHLCRSIESWKCTPLSEESRLIVQRELGDEAVRSALAIAFQSTKAARLKPDANVHPGCSTPR
jgi:glycosyltransferase involved in cell wall biosynthesis